MAERPTDGFDIARWKLDDGDLTTDTYPDDDPNMGLHAMYGAFVDDIGSRNMWVNNRTFAQPNAHPWQARIPARIFNRRVLGFFGGTQHRAPAWVEASSELEPTILTISAFVYPFVDNGLNNYGCVFRKSYQNCDPGGRGDGLGSVAPPTWSVGFGLINSGTNGGWCVDWTTGGVRTRYSIGDGTLHQNGYDSRLRVRSGQWNHIGFSHDTETLRMYTNGILAREVNCGQVDYGEHAQWQLGGEFRINSPVDRLDGMVTDLRIASVARPLSWFEDMYMSILEGEQATGPPDSGGGGGVVPPTIVGVGPGGPSLGVD